VWICILTQKQDGAMAAGAAADKKIHIMDLNSQQTMTLEGHTAPVRAVRFVQVPSANGPIIASGSWDKTVRYWDLRQPQPIGTLQLPERVYAMDAVGPHLVAAAADNQLHFANLHGNPLQLWKSVKSPLTNQTSTVSLCAGGTRWAVGGIEGRAAAQAVDDKDKTYVSLSTP
jgi:mRNA export factor